MMCSITVLMLLLRQVAADAFLRQVSGSNVAPVSQLADRVYHFSPVPVAAQAREVASAQQERPSFLRRFMANQQEAKSTRVEAIVSSFKPILGSFMAHQQEAKSKRVEAIKRAAKGIAREVKAVARDAADEVLGGNAMPAPKLIPIPVRAERDPLYANRVPQQYPSRELLAQASFHIASIPFMTLIGLLVGTAITFAVFFFRHRTSTIGKEALLG